VQLVQVEMVRPQAQQGALQLSAGALGRAVGGLAGEEQAFPEALDARPHLLLGVAVGWSDVEVRDPGLVRPPAGGGRLVGALAHQHHAAQPDDRKAVGLVSEVAWLDAHVRPS